MSTTPIIPDTVMDENGGQQINLRDLLAKFEQYRQWEIPKSVPELLERAYEWAQDEAHWIAGKWVEPRFESDDQWAEWDSESGREVFPTGMTCQNVAACAMGILVLCTYNGPLIRAYYPTAKDAKDAKQPSFGSLAVETPMINDAAKYLAIGLRMSTNNRRAQESPIAYKTWDWDEALSEILEENQDCCRSWVDWVVNLNDNSATHPDIVEGFRLAVDKAREEATA